MCIYMQDRNSSAVFSKLPNTSAETPEYANLV